MSISYINITPQLDLLGSWNDTIYCQILTHSDHLQVIKSTVIPIWYEKWDLNDDNTYYNPTLISCRLPVQQNHFLLKAFSLTKTPCKLANRFYEVPRPVNEKLRNFTICVKPLNFDRDISKHLVQWIEICKILGAEYFYIFLGNITKNTRKILEWYKANFPNMIYLQDFKPVYTNYTSSRSLLHRTWQRRRYEIIAYNHCFYKNINSKYIIPIDTDELIVPKVTATWQELIKHLNNNYSSLIVQNVYFFSKGKSYLNKPFFLKEITRTKLVSKKGENSKSLISTKNTLTVFNHYSLHLLRPGVIKEYFLPFRDVQLNHYKEFCNSVIFPECSKYLSSPRIIDNVMFKYRDRFIQQYRDVLNKIREDKIKL